MADKKVSCDCGATIRKSSDEALIEAVKKHAKEVHDMDLTPDQVLSMAEPIPSEG